MKKIALLFIITCTGQLYGMEPTKPKPGRYIGLENLPQEVQVIIVSSLHTYDNPDDLIHALKAISRTNTTLRKMIFTRYGSFCNLKEFTTLVHILADQFNLSTKDIANKFNTPTSKYYVELGDKLRNYVFKSTSLTNHIDEVTKLIEQGADVNYSKQSNSLTALHQAVMNINPKMVQFLLDHGANQNLKYTGMTALEWAQKIYQSQPRNYQAKEIVQILKEALQKFPNT